MAVRMPGDWVDRLSRSLRAHEGERRETQESLPRYETLSELGRGGMGIVYRAWDPQLGREVALKVLLESAGGAPEARERFLREAQLASRLNHPHIVPVYDTGEWMGQAYMALRLVDGTTLDKAGLDLRGNLAALRDAARALHHAHQEGIVHRDVKPSNLLADREGRVYVTDFGVARQLNVPAKLTLTGVVIGTPAYMPPEQAQGLTVDARSDVYSLGATMYDILSGRPPFQESDAVANVVATIFKDPPPPQSHNPRLPSAVQKIILKAMEKEPELRYATAADLADDIQRYLDGVPIRARPAPFKFRARRFIIRYRWPAALAAVVVLGMVGYFVSRSFSEWNRVNRELEEKLARIVLHVRGEEFPEAQSILEQMVAIAPQHRKTRDARVFLREAEAQYATLKTLEKSALESLDNRALSEVWDVIDALRDLELPRVPGESEEPVSFPAVQSVERALTDRLKSRIRMRAIEASEHSSPDTLRKLVALARRIDPKLRDDTVRRFREVVQTWSPVLDLDVELEREAAQSLD